MKSIKIMKRVLFSSVICMLIFSNGYTQNTKESNIKDSDVSSESNFYFGEKPPGLIPKLFAPNLVSMSGRHEFGISFSPDLKEVYFSAVIVGEKIAIYHSRLNNKKWSSIKKADFTKGEKDTEMKPFVSLTEDKIYFTAYNAATRSPKIWYVRRTKDSWSEAKPIESPINNDRVFWLTQGKTGGFYYTNHAKRKMFYVTDINPESEIEDLNIEFGTQGCISPSQDYLVVNARKKEYEQNKTDLYVYFKMKDGTWSKPIRFGEEINSNVSETVPSITPDGKYMFFSRYNEKGGLSNFYWVSTEVIEKLRPKQ